MGLTVQQRDLEWLRELDGELWTEKDEHSRTHGLRKVKVELPRRLTDEEWGRVTAVVAEHRLPVTMTNTCFGFGVGMILFEPEREWIYPGVEGESQPSSVTMISQAHLPPSESTFDGEDKRIKFDDGWRCFSPLTHADSNLEILRRCSFPAPRRKGDYEY